MVERNDAWLHPETFYQGFCSTLIQGIVDKTDSGLPQLNIVAIGALTYSDVWEGNSDRNEKELELAEALRLRVYHIVYQKQSGAPLVATLTRVATGSASHLGHLSSDLGILEPYWLG